MLVSTAAAITPITTAAQMAEMKAFKGVPSLRRIVTSLAG